MPLKAKRTKTVDAEANFFLERNGKYKRKINLGYLTMFTSFYS